MWDFLKGLWKKVPKWLAAPAVILITLVAFGSGIEIGTPKGTFSCQLTHDIIPGMTEATDVAKEALQKDTNGGVAPTVKETVVVPLKEPSCTPVVKDTLTPETPTFTQKVRVRMLDLNRIRGQCQ